ncbi:MAG: hypothetical protein ABIR80_06345 [Opitutaceae bacterium]
MKKFCVALVTVTLAAAFALAQGSAKKDSAPASGATPGVVTLQATAAVITAPMVLKDGALTQPEHEELTLAAGGKAVFDFSVAAAGTYAIHAVVNAPSDLANSFFVNIDGLPEDPLSVWDIDPTSGFEERIVSWRGGGDAENNEFKPKHFKLTAGAHKLILVGREASFLKSVSIRLVGN